MVARIAGGALSLLGVALVVLALIGLTSIQLVLTSTGAVIVLLAGLTCAALGVLVWRRSRLATLVALLLLVTLAVLQATALLASPLREAADVWRLALTAALAVLLALAARALPGRATGRPGSAR